MSKQPKVYIITLNWNRADDTSGCVDSLRELQYENCAFVICDNASKADQIAALRQWGGTLPGGLPEFNADQWPHVQPGELGSSVLIHTGGNLGYAGGMNAGIRYALAAGDADYVWVLNNDTVVAPDSLSWLVDRMLSDQAIGICGSSLIYFEDRQKVQAHGGAAYLPWRARSVAIGAFGRADAIPESPEDVESRMAYVIGASMLVSRKYLESVGLMDASFFLYSEEHDWAQRGRKQGFRLGYAPRSLVFHKHGATIGTSPSGGSELSLFYLYRNKAIFAARHYPWLLPLSLPFLCWDGVKFLLKNKPSKARAVFRGLVAFPGKGLY
jgi:GT2 family glycosyltransferase